MIIAQAAVIAEEPVIWTPFILEMERLTILKCAVGAEDVPVLAPTKL